MQRPNKQAAIVGFLLWEGYWAYVFFSAPRPDEKMDTVFALLMAVIVPILIGATFWIGVWRGDWADDETSLL